MEKVDNYTFHIIWDYKTRNYAAFCDEFPLLIEHDDNASSALDKLKIKLAAIITDPNYAGPTVLKSQRVYQLERAIIKLLSWSETGHCSDCIMYQDKHKEFYHARDCGYLETLNFARALVGKEPINGHNIDKS